MHRTLCAALGILLSGCASISQIGTVGTLRVFSIKETDFFSANRLLLVIDENGRAVAAAGGTVAGPGPIAAGLVGSAIVGGGVAYAGHAVGAGLKELDSLKVSGSVHLVP